MDSKNPLFSLFQEIEKYLEENEEGLNRFNLLKMDYLESTQGKSEIYDKIYQLIQENESLVAALESAKLLFDKYPSPVDLIRDFTLFFTKNLSETPELVSTLTHLTSLFVENFISFDFLCFYINSSCPEKLFDEKLEELKQCLDETHQQIRQKFLPSIKIPEGSDIFMKGRPSLGAQLLVMISLIIEDQEQQQSILKCLKLYGLQLIPYEAAYNWLNSINEFIGKQFENDVNNLGVNPSTFIPTVVLTDLLQTNTELQLMWAFGNDFYDTLKKIPKSKNNEKSALQLNNSQLLEKNRKLNSHTQKAAIYIAELQSIKFFTTLKASGEALRKGEQLITSIPEGVIEALFGHESQLDKTDIFYRILFDKCYEFGQKSTDIQLSLLQQKFSSFDPSSPDGRTAYHELVRPTFVLRQIIFSGKELKMPENQILNLTLEIAEKTVARFSKLTEKYQKMVKVLKSPGQFDIDDHAALSIFYFMLLSSLIEKVDESKFQTVKQIPQLIFEKPAPLSDFDNDEIANVDIVLKNFVKNLHKADEDQFFDQSKPHFNSNFVFHLDVGGKIVISKGIMNPIAYMNE